MKDFATREYQVRMRRGDKPIIVRGQRLTTLFAFYPHTPSRDVTRVVLVDDSGTICFDGTLWLFGECMEKGYFRE